MVWLVAVIALNVLAIALWCVGSALRNITAKLNRIEHLLRPDRGDKRA